MALDGVYAGDKLEFSESYSAYPASDGWIVRYILNDARTRITFDSTPDGDAHDFTVTAAVTATWRSGEYQLTRRAINGTDVKTIDVSTWHVWPNPETVPLSDQRSHAKKMLEAIEAALLKAASAEQLAILRARHNIADIESDYEKLLRLRGIYRGEVRQEEAAERIARGLGDPNTIRVRFQ